MRTLMQARRLRDNSTSTATGFLFSKRALNRVAQRKGDCQPEEVEVYSNIYFGPYLSDGYEGLFW
jgi:hypothetical protein